jgi:hypothetical protein
MRDDLDLFDERLIEPAEDLVVEAEPAESTRRIGIGPVAPAVDTETRATRRPGRPNRAIAAAALDRAILPVELRRR